MLVARTIQLPNWVEDARVDMFAKRNACCETLFQQIESNGMQDVDMFAKRNACCEKFRVAQFDVLPLPSTCLLNGMLVARLRRLPLPGDGWKSRHVC